MSRLAEAFETARQDKRAALVIYVCAGDPDLDTTLELMNAAADAGADVIEVGVPFSDPTADGPVIQRASERALASGTTLCGVLQLVSRFREHRDTALMLFGYYNPILAMGEARAAREAAEAGVDGFLVVDLPPEEASPLVTELRKNGLDFVPLVAPTTTSARLARIRDVAGAFVYYVSLTGVTGASTDLVAAAERASRLSEQLELPVAVGFGVKSAADATTVARKADGVVVGSAVCLAVEGAASKVDAVAQVRALVSSLRAGCAR